MKIPRVGGVAVFYNPSDENIENLKEWIVQCDEFVIYDNSPSSNLSRFDEGISKKIVYHHDSKNAGIAQALNWACSYFIDRNFDWVLTLDQDSAAVKGMVKSLFELYEVHPQKEKIGILSPMHWIVHSKEEPEREDIEYPLEVMTSGNLLYLPIWRIMGGFDESLFIDCVDTDYCLRMRVSGYLTIQAYRIRMNHSLGERTKNIIVGRDYYPTHHSALRRYYMTRNRLLMIKKFKTHFPEFAAVTHKAIYREWMMIWLFEKDKWKKNWMVLKAFKDFYLNRFGKLS